MRRVDLVVNLTEADLVRFWSYANRRGEDECWIWKNRPGEYGSFGWGNQLSASSHRVSYAIANGGTIPAGLYVLHKCDNPPCCNPNHLILGTQSDNVRDCMAKGRYSNGRRRSVKPHKPDDVRLELIYSAEDAAKLDGICADRGDCSRAAALRQLVREESRRIAQRAKREKETK